METNETIEVNYTGATQTEKLEQSPGPKRLRYRKNRQAAAERQFLALRNTKPDHLMIQNQKEAHGQ